MQLRSGFALNNAAGELQRGFPDPLAGFKGPLCGVKGRGQGRREGTGREGK